MRKAHHLRTDFEGLWHRTRIFGGPRHPGVYVEGSAVVVRHQQWFAQSISAIINSIADRRSPITTESRIPNH